MNQSKLISLRYERTLKSNRVRRSIDWMLAEPAKWTSENGLPSWWPFYSDSLKNQVRKLYRVCLELAQEEERAR